MEEDLNLKKKIMFSVNDDLYYIIYNIIIILEKYKCKSPKKTFKNFIKIAFLSTIISNDAYVFAFRRLKNRKNISDIDLISKAFIEGLVNIENTKRGVFILEKRKIITVNKKDNSIYINSKNINKEFELNKVFNYEIINLEDFNALFDRISMLTLNTFIEKVFKDNGVESWQALKS